MLGWMLKGSNAIASNDFRTRMSETTSRVFARLRARNVEPVQVFARVASNWLQVKEEIFEVQTSIKLPFQRKNVTVYYLW
jgi:hypothetical protein